MTSGTRLEISSKSSSPQPDTAATIATRAVISLIEGATLTDTTERAPVGKGERPQAPRRRALRSDLSVRVTRKPHKSRGRRWRVLGALANFVRKNAWLPSATELSAFIGRGSRWTMWRDLQALVRYGYVQKWRRCWAMTAAGWERLGETPVYHRFDRRPPNSYREVLLTRLTRNLRRGKKDAAALRKLGSIAAGAVPIVEC